MLMFDLVTVSLTNRTDLNYILRFSNLICLKDGQEWVIKIQKYKKKQSNLPILFFRIAETLIVFIISQLFYYYK